MSQHEALKGVDVVGTGDYTHPEWFAELSAELEPAEDGLYRLRAPWRDAVEREVRFMLSVEISTIYKKGEKTRKIHHIVILPSLDAVARLNQRLGAIGNLHADGRPILGLDSRDLLEICLEADPNALFVLAHIWTPHFAALGAAVGVGPKSKRVRSIYDRLLAELGPELGILRRADPAEIEACAGVLVADALRRGRYLPGPRRRVRDHQRVQQRGARAAAGAGGIGAGRSAAGTGRGRASLGWSNARLLEHRRSM